jgi:hypothetical protein
MPAFIFEKLSGPIRRVSGAVASAERRGALGRLLDRFAESRLRRSERDIDRAKRAVNAITSRVHH